MLRSGSLRPCYSDATMRLFLGIAVYLTVAVAGLAQTASAPVPELPKDPRALLELAQSHYNFSDPALKPWHMKANYQLYDELGKPTEQGVFEYWWASPKVYRSSWTRPSASHTEWNTADGKKAYKDTGAILHYYEFKLQPAFLSPLPNAAETDPAKFQLDRQEVKLPSTKLECAMVTPLMRQLGYVPLGSFPTYCFDQKFPAVRISYSSGSTTTEFKKIATVQGRYLAREIILTNDQLKILTAQVDVIDGITTEDAALTPPTDAQSKSPHGVSVSAGVAVGMLLKTQAPIYPEDAKQAHATGTVVLQAVIGGDGNIHDLHIVSAPWPSLAAAAMQAVSHWKYRPYLLKGEPVEVQTTINVIFTLGG